MQTLPLFSLALLAMGIGSAACMEPAEERANLVERDAGTLFGGGVTYHEHVKPLLARVCVQCHSAGQIAPLALTGYDEVMPLARRIALATRARTMPPFLADNSGHCSTYRDALWLTEAEIGTLERWAEQGAPEGVPTPPPELVPGPELVGETLSLVTPDYTPNASRPDDYRCFVVDAAATSSDADFVTGFDVHPGDRRMVHHVIVYHPQTEDQVALARELDAREEGPGYSCFGGSGVRGTAVAAWAPGQGATRYPDNLGIELASGRSLIVQMHYNTLAGLGADRTRVVLETRKSGVAKARFVPIADINLTLAPGLTDARAGATLRVSDYTNLRAPVRIYGVFPHMHTLGTSMRVELVRGDGTRACIVDLPRWDFHWQRFYFHQTPFVLSPDDRLSVMCRYDTRSRLDVTRWGEGTLDEMCVAGVFVAL